MEYQTPLYPKVNHGYQALTFNGGDREYYKIDNGPYGQECSVNLVRDCKGGPPFTPETAPLPKPSFIPGKLPIPVPPSGSRAHAHNDDDRRRLIDRALAPVLARQAAERASGGNVGCSANGIPCSPLYDECCGYCFPAGIVAGFCVDAASSRENYGNSKLKDLQVDVYYTKYCGHCKALLKALKDAGETENVTLKDVSDPKHSAEMKKHKLGGGVPAMRSNTTGKTQIGNPGTIDALVAKLS
jgi:glutaredoxin